LTGSVLLAETLEPARHGIKRRRTVPGAAHRGNNSGREAGRVTAKIFWQDAYLTRLETRVTGVDGNEVTLAETIFFAFSGGQESDRGSLGGRPVRAARTAGREIVYTLDDGHGLSAGQPVTVAIDWPRRYRLMRLHFAAELVLELATRRFPKIEKIGAHIAEDKARIDFRWPANIAAELPALRDEAMRIVSENQPIVSAYSDEENQRRYWKIKEFEPVPCGGTHLKATGEVGEITLKRKNLGRGKERIEIALRDASA
jgi:Ser-tRNA(Ala) deacylase AlaX